MIAGGSTWQVGKWGGGGGEGKMGETEAGRKEERCGHRKRGKREDVLLEGKWTLCESLLPMIAHLLTAHSAVSSTD